MRTQFAFSALALASLITLTGCGGGSMDTQDQQFATDVAARMNASQIPTPSICATTPSLCAETPQSVALVKQAAKATPKATSTISALTPSMLMDWAEQTFPTYFPGHSNTVTGTGFVYRFYAATNNFVAVKDDGSVYILPAGGQVTYVAPMTDFTCQVTPTACTVLLLSKVSADPTVPNYGLMMYPQKFTVKLLDALGKPVANQAVTWTANGGGWTIPSSSVTAADGTAQVNWVPGYGVNPQLTATASNYQGTTTVTYSGLLKADVQIDGSRTPNASFAEYWAQQSVNGISREITPLTEPAGTYYAVIGWNSGYTGIQRAGSNYDRQIQFSVWNQNGVAASIVNSGTSICLDFSHEGSGVMCSNSYPWAINKTYRFEMTTATVVAGSTDITMYFIDVATGSRLFLATLRHAGTPSMQSAYSFSEDFKRTAMGCQNVPERRAVFGNTKIRQGTTWVAAFVNTRQSYITDPTVTCANTGHTMTSTGYELGIGGTVRNTQVDAGWVTVN